MMQASLVYLSMFWHNTY